MGEIVMSETVSVDKLIERFTDMADRGTLLTGRNDISQNDLLFQIIGAIVKTASEEEKRKVLNNGAH